MTVQIGNKFWGLPEIDKHPEMVTYSLVKVLDRDSWGCCERGSARVAKYNWQAVSLD